MNTFNTNFEIKVLTSYFEGSWGGGRNSVGRVVWCPVWARDFSLVQNIQAGSGTLPVSYSVDNGSSLYGSKAAGMSS